MKRGIPDRYEKRTERKKMKTAGLDIGTTGCKLTVFGEHGERLGKAYREYPADRKSRQA